MDDWITEGANEVTELDRTRVTVIVAEDIALVLHQDKPPTAESAELLALVEELDLVLEPMHPGIKDVSLAQYFTVEAPDPDTAQRLIDRLLESGLGHAYVKPADELP